MSDWLQFVAAVAAACAWPAAIVAIVLILKNAMERDRKGKR